MSLININADLSRTAAALERIALAVEQLVYLTVNPRARALFQHLPRPEGVQDPPPPVKRGPQSISYFDEEKAWSEEQEDLRRRSFQTPEDLIPSDQEVLEALEEPETEEASQTS